MPSVKTKPRKPSRKPNRTAKAAKTTKKKKPVSGGSYDPVAPARVRDILARLDDRYSNVTCALTHRTPWELLVATILSAQCTDATVNKVTPELFRKYPTPQALAALEPEELEPMIRPTGFFRNKSKSLVG